MAEPISDERYAKFRRVYPIAIPEEVHPDIEAIFARLDAAEARVRETNERIRGYMSGKGYLWHDPWTADDLIEMTDRIIAQRDDAWAGLTEITAISDGWRDDYAKATKRITEIPKWNKFRPER